MTRRQKAYTVFKDISKLAKIRKDCTDLKTYDELGSEIQFFFGSVGYDYIWVDSRNGKLEPFISLPELLHRIKDLNDCELVIDDLDLLVNLLRKTASEITLIQRWTKEYNNMKKDRVRVNR